MPWGDDALSLAKGQKKLMIISVGYSSCHWCHVMEEETFSNEEAAKIMNDKFINVKVDREERPDVDELYMKSLVLMTGSGGWPMNIIALPDGSPIWGGTYLPKDNWINVLNQIDELYKTRYEDVLDYSTKLKVGLKPKEIIENKFESSELLLKIKNATKLSFNSLDIVNGGLRSFQKFHLPSMIDYYLRGGNQFEEKKYSDFVDLTLKNISYGGINDHIEGGLHRYTVDSIWHVPHFEKMLYDNAQLMEAYLVGYQLTKNEDYLTVISQILEWLKDEMIDKDGGFYSSMDADSVGVEGKYYVWNPEEIESVLSENDAKIFNQYYDISKTGNWEGNSIPNVIMKKSSLSTLLKIPESDISLSLEKSRLAIKKHRKSRIAPGTDDKIIVSWNGLMISSLAKVSAFLDDKEYFEIADRAVSFIVDKMSKDDGSLNRVYRDNLSHIDAFAEDYSYFGNALIDMYEASFDSKYLELSKKYADILVDKFFNDGYFKQSLSKNMVINSVNSMDNATPSYNFMCSLLLVRLYYYYDIKKYREIAEASIDKVGTYINQYSYAHSTALIVHNFLSNGPKEIVMVAEDNSNPLMNIVKQTYVPCKILVSSSTEIDLPILEGKKMIDNQSTVYICKNYVCKEPIVDALKLRKMLAL